MNKLIETINYASDTYWGDKERFKFNAKIDTYNNTTEIAQGENRTVKTNFGLTLQGYLIPESINKELVSRPQKSFTKSVVTFNTELIVDPARAPKTRKEVRDAPQRINIEQVGSGVGYQLIGQTNEITIGGGIGGNDIGTDFVIQ